MKLVDKNQEFVLFAVWAHEDRGSYLTWLTVYSSIKIKAPSVQPAGDSRTTMSDRVVPFGSSKSGPETDDEGNTTTVVKRNKRTRSFARSNTEFRSKRHSAIRVSERLSNIEIQAGSVIPQ